MQLSRKELGKKINQYASYIISSLADRNLISYQTPPQLIPYEIYQTTSIIGTLVFEYKFRPALEITKDLDSIKTEITNLLEGPLKRYIFLILCCANDDNTSINSMRFSINFEEIDYYLTDLCNDCFRGFGFKGKKDFLEVFSKYNMQELFNPTKGTISKYKIYKDTAEISVITINVDYQNQLKDFRRFVSTSTKFKIIHEYEPIYIFSKKGILNTIKFINAKGKKGFILTNALKYNRVTKNIGEKTKKHTLENNKTSEFIAKEV